MGAKEKIQFQNWQVEIERKPFRRSISIILHPQKPILVRAAVLTPQKVIIDFLLAKKNWIEKSLQKQSEQKEKFPERKIRDQENFPFLGVERPLKVVITLTKKPFISMTDSHILAHIPRDEWSALSLEQEHDLREEVREFYKREAISYITQRTQFLSEQMKLHPRQLKFREQKTRWGSCSSNGTITLNWRLIVFKPELVDYVIVHELAHLKHLNHSKNFWELVEKQMPNYKQHAIQLKDQQMMDQFLKLESK